MRRTLEDFKVPVDDLVLTGMSTPIRSPTSPSRLAPLTTSSAAPTPDAVQPPAVDGSETAAVAALPTGPSCVALAAASAAAGTLLGAAVSAPGEATCATQLASPLSGSSCRLALSSEAKGQRVAAAAPFATFAATGTTTAAIARSDSWKRQLPPTPEQEAFLRAPRRTTSLPATLRHHTSEGSAAAAAAAKYSPLPAKLRQLVFAAADAAPGAADAEPGGDPGVADAAPPQVRSLSAVSPPLAGGPLAATEQRRRGLRGAAPPSSARQRRLVRQGSPTPPFFLPWLRPPFSSQAVLYPASACLDGWLQPTA